MITKDDFAEIAFVKGREIDKLRPALKFTRKSGLSVYFQSRNTKALLALLPQHGYGITVKSSYLDYL